MLGNVTVLYLQDFRFSLIVHIYVTAIVFFNCLFLFGNYRTLFVHKLLNYMYVSYCARCTIFNKLNQLVHLFSSSLFIRCSYMFRAMPSSWSFLPNRLLLVSSERIKKIDHLRFYSYLVDLKYHGR
jgi:hypothetical protein